jgi:predicted ArsR family transcriptional regulator
MEGMTITEMAEILGIAPNTVMQRLYVAKIKPITKEALYDKSALEAIRNVPGKGRPPKTKPEAPEKANNVEKPLEKFP